MRNGRRIGAQFERRLAIDLRQWLGEDFTVSRNPTDRQKGQTGTAGEFEIAGPYTFPFVIEAKAHSSFSLRQLFRSPITGPLESWWEQACEQADSINHSTNEPAATTLLPLLICREKGYPVVAIMRYHTSRALQHAARSTLESPMHVARVEVFADVMERETLHVWRWDDLLEVDSMALRELTL